MTFPDRNGATALPGRISTPQHGQPYLCPFPASRHLHRSCRRHRRVGLAEPVPTVPNSSTTILPVDGCRKGTGKPLKLPEPYRKIGFAGTSSAELIPLNPIDLRTPTSTEFKSEPSDETLVVIDCLREALMELVLKVEDAAGWIYRGEGAANIVLGYRGSSPSFVGKVIRVQKLPRNGSDSQGWEVVLSAYERIIWKDIEVQTESMSNEVLGRLYVLNVMSPLLGSKHVDAGKHVPVSRDFLESLEEQVQSLRPSWRVDEAKVNVLCDSALLISDHSLFIHESVREDRCIAVEIKPKCGFLPVSNFIAEDNFMKKCVSRFKMHQFSKLHKKEIGEISEYDPVDLFSGSKDRINRAMKSLYAIPQNNFRIFFDGSLLFGGLGGAMVNTKSKSMDAIDDELGVLIDATPGRRLSRFLELVSVTILQSGVLVGLLNTQVLDLLDIEGAIHAYYNIISQPCMVCKELGDLSKKYFSLHSLSLEASVKIVRDFLIAATAKDCSLMISFRPLSGEMISEIDVVHLETTGQSFCYKAHFIDLDMKPLKKMVHYYKLDQEIVNFYTEMNKTSDSVKVDSQCYG